MKNIFTLLLVFLISNSVFAGPYLMTKHEFKMKDTDYSSTINHIRFGLNQQLKILGKQRVA